jgi:hypothetical protein
MTMNIVSQSLAGLPSFLEYFALGLVLLGAFVAVYGWMTPYDERALIRKATSPRRFRSPARSWASCCRSGARSRTASG